MFLIFGKKPQKSFFLLILSILLNKILINFFSRFYLTKFAGLLAHSVKVSYLVNILKNNKFNWHFSVLIKCYLFNLGFHVPRIKGTHYYQTRIMMALLTWPKANRKIFKLVSLDTQVKPNILSTYSEKKRKTVQCKQFCIEEILENAFNNPRSGHLYIFMWWLLMFVLTLMMAMRCVNDVVVAVDVLVFISRCDEYVKPKNKFVLSLFSNVCYKSG